MGSTGHWPVPLGDPPGGTETGVHPAPDTPTAWNALAVPLGGSPVLPCSAAPPRCWRAALGFLMLLPLWLTCGLHAQVPLPNAHAHNDYEHTRPLFDALDHGFCSVEADIHLVNGKLLVAHDPDKVDPKRTLEALYLEPLRQRIEKFHGTVYPGGPDFYLLIDVKTEAEPTYSVLRNVLKGYSQMLTEFGAGQTRRRAVTAVISGNRPFATMSNEVTRLAGIDGRLPDLKTNPSPSLFPWVSDNWTKYFQWRGEGPLPENEKSKLKDWVTQAHKQGRKIRFWGLPDTADVWRELRDAKVDFINTDDLEGLQRFLTKAR